MDFLNDEHLKIETPKTTDGRSLVFNEVTGKPMYNITFLPLTALRSLEIENQNRENNLKHKITRVPGRTFVPQEDPTAALKKRIVELEAEKAAPLKDDPTIALQKRIAELEAEKTAAEKPAKEKDKAKSKENEGI